MDCENLLLRVEKNSDTDADATASDTASAVCICYAVLGGHFALQCKYTVNTWLSFAETKQNKEQEHGTACTSKVECNTKQLASPKLNETRSNPQV